MPKAHASVAASSDAAVGPEGIEPSPPRVRAGCASDCATDLWVQRDVRVRADGTRDERTNDKTNESEKGEMNDANEHEAPFAVEDVPRRPVSGTRGTRTLIPRGKSPVLGRIELASRACGRSWKTRLNALHHGQIPSLRNMIEP